MTSHKSSETVVAAIIEALLSHDLIRPTIALHVPDMRATPEAATKLIFHAPNSSLRLTGVGDKIMQMAYQPWTCEIPAVMTVRQRLLLVHESKFPYYLHRNTFTTYDRMLGMKLRLADGSLDRIEEVLFR